MIMRFPPRPRSIGVVVLSGAVALATLANGCVLRRPTAAPAGSPTLRGMARRVGGDVVERLLRGYHPERSADVAIVAEPSNVVVRWSGTSLDAGIPDPRTTHATPWSYHQRVPIVLYGPGYVTKGIRSNAVADVADLAPTLAELMRFPFRAVDGEVLSGALLPAGRRKGRPRVIVVVAFDGGGWNLFQRYPAAWPMVRRLAREGATYLNATIGSSPSVTAAIHATMGTGAYPRTHGIPEHAIRRPDGSVGDVFRGQEADPSLLAVETVADAWDRENGNRPWTGLVATEAWHLGMLGKGALASGGDRDVAVFWDRDGLRFHTNQEAYSLPSELPGRAVLDRHLQDLDATDGARDGAWMGNDLASPRVILGSPAFVRYQGGAVLDILRREQIGRDDLTDLLFVEFKSTDLGAHIWNLVGPEEPHVLRAQDEVVEEMVRLLDRLVGRDRYVIALTADHGLTPLPETVGGIRIHPDVVGERVDEYFGRDLVERVTPAGLYLDRQALADAGITVTEVARFVSGLRYRDVLPPDADPGDIPSDVADDRVFAAVLPAAFLQALTEDAARSFGPGAFPEGNLTSPQHPYADVLRG